MASRTISLAIREAVTVAIEAGELDVPQVAQEIADRHPLAGVSVQEIELEIERELARLLREKREARPLTVRLQGSGIRGEAD